MKNTASMPNPPQLKILRTMVVERIPFLRKWSASRPPLGTITVINKWGSAPTNPVCHEQMIKGPLNSVKEEHRKGKGGLVKNKVIIGKLSNFNSS